MFKIFRFSFLTSVATLVITFVTGVLIARDLGPAYRGEWASVTLLLSMVTILSPMGMCDAYIFNKRKYYLDVNLLPIIGYVLLISSIIAMFILYFMGAYGGNELYSVIILIFISLVASVLNSLSRIDEDLRTFNKIKIYKALILCAFVVCFYCFKLLTLSNLINVSIFVEFFTVLYCFRYSTLKQASGLNLIKFDFFRFHDFGIKFQLTIFTGFIINNFDKIYLYINAQSIDFGIYSVAFAASRLIGILPNTVSNVLFSNLAGKNSKDISEKTNLIFSIVFTPLVVISCTYAISFYFFIPYLYGEEYKASTIPFVILTFECAVSGLGWILAQRFNSIGKPGLVFARQAVSLTPLVFLFFYMPEIEISILLSLIMLLCSLIRFGITLLLYLHVLKEKLPRFWPERNHINKLIEMLKN